MREREREGDRGEKEGWKEIERQKEKSSLIGIEKQRWGRRHSMTEQEKKEGERLEGKHKHY